MCVGTHSKTRMDGSDQAPTLSSLSLSIRVMGIIVAPSGGVNGVHLKPRAQSCLFPGDLQSGTSAPLNSAGRMGKEFSS